MEFSVSRGCTATGCSVERKQWLRLPLWNTVVVYNNYVARGPWYPRLAYGYPVECILPRSSYDSRPEPVYARLGKELPAGFTAPTLFCFPKCGYTIKEQWLRTRLWLRRVRQCSLLVTTLGWDSLLLTWAQESFRGLSS